MKNTFKSIHEKIFLRLILMITIYLFCNNIWGFVVATVGNKIITSEELKSNISVNIHNKRYKKERKQVLKKLIKEKKKYYLFMLKIMKYQLMIMRLNPILLANSATIQN